MATGIVNALRSGQDSPDRLRRVDAVEAAALRAYRCRRQMAAMVVDAERRADAAARLDAALRRPVAA